MQRIFDEVVLGLVGMYICCAAPKQLFHLFWRQRGYGLWRVRVAAPRLADEKFLWRKIFDHNPLFVIASDKIESKRWVADKNVGIEAPQTLWVGTDANEIPDTLWQQQIYVKAAHGWRTNIPVLSPPDDRTSIISKANSFMRYSHGRRHKEWSYQYVPHRLMVEEAVFADRETIEIKFYTFGRIVEQFVLTRYGDTAVSGRWLRQQDGSYAIDDKPTTHGDKIDNKPLPPVIDKVLTAASQIGAHFDQMRFDTITDGHKDYLGELTVYNLSGRAHHQGHYADAPQNRNWDLRRSWFLSKPQSGWRATYANALRRRIDRREQLGFGLA